VRTIHLIKDGVANGAQMLTRFIELGSDIFDGHHITMPTHQSIWRKGNGLESAELTMRRQGVP
jgi:hypothetical protein